MATYLYCVLAPPNPEAIPNGLTGISGSPVRVLVPAATTHMEVWVATIDDGALRGLVGPGTTLGEGCVIGPNARIGSGCRIGHFVVIHADTAVGSEVRIDDHATLGKLPMRAASTRNSSSTGSCSSTGTSSPRTRATSAN